jgi:hypothetical protein
LCRRSRKRGRASAPAGEITSEPKVLAPAVQGGKWPADPRRTGNNGVLGNEFREIGLDK